MLDTLTTLSCRTCNLGEFCHSPGSCSRWMQTSTESLQPHCRSTRAWLWGSVGVTALLLALAAFMLVAR